ncbi:DEAD/DEAH box helicase [Roseomonas arctica]|uniref:DEAD/DEAH box helicase n=1 Tax=Plastoroseomonas arctica TaxID=1509237 RepID=A0AAF1JXS8_9PROT|nr:DEAD/DEAH box helicase [Plastoroseomonas arctica]MBR0656042.1 DEAD/DEAH box helicase [Plastoroseomonas arctica]
MPFPNLPPLLAAALAERGYTEPTPVQDAVLAAEPGRDLLVSAQTGSGKTVAFGLAMAAELLPEGQRVHQTRTPLALAVAPTRELALQVARELEWLYGPTGARIATCVGGMDIKREMRMLQQGVHIVVGTPGRLCDHLERGSLDASAVRTVILDEADEMLDLGFREELEKILSAAPETRRSLLFSATMPRAIQELARRYQRDALRIEVGREGGGHADIEHRAVLCNAHEMEKAIVNLLRWYEAGGALVFCNTRESVNRLQGNLQERGFSVVALSGELSQNERTRALQSLRDARVRVCVATDVAARGIDLPDLGLVIHAELPRDAETLQHRSGRTGRAGRKGVSVFLVPYPARKRAERLFQGARVTPSWSPAPAAAEVRARDEERLLDDPALREEPGEDDLAIGRKMIEARGAETVAAAFARMARARLPEPEDLAAAAPVPKPRERVAPRDASAAGAWFRMGIGRAGNADPKWLIPYLCRRFNITKAEIGSIRIASKETQVEIAPSVAAQVETALRGEQRPDDIRMAALR